MRFVAIILLALALTGAAAAAPPQAALVVPGQSMGELELGLTRKQVERQWGRAYGVCTGCAGETWYFNYYAFRPNGAGVEFRNGRVSAIYTIYSPTGWHTAKGLALGDPVTEVTALYGALSRHECGNHYALLLPRAGSLTVFYILHQKLWAFGLLRSGLPVCR
jgi:hypothetical protein